MQTRADNRRPIDTEIDDRLLFIGRAIGRWPKHAPFSSCVEMRARAPQLVVETRPTRTGSILAPPLSESLDVELRLHSIRAQSDERKSSA